MNRDNRTTTIAKSAASIILLAPLLYLATPAGATAVGFAYSAALPIAFIPAALSLGSTVYGTSEKASERQAKTLNATSIALPLIAAVFDLAFVFHPAPAYDVVLVAVCEAGVVFPPLAS